MGRIETSLNERLASIISGMGYAFVHAEWHKGLRQSSLRIYIDKEGGVTLTDCTNVSRQISAIMDVEAPIQGHYCLEVSSPGVNRKLYALTDYQQYVGREVSLRLRQPLEGRRQFRGHLLWVKDQDICVQLETEEKVLPFSNIGDGHIIAELFPKKSSAGGGRTGSGKVKRG